MHKKSESDVMLEGLKSENNIRQSETLQRLGMSLRNWGSGKAGEERPDDHGRRLTLQKAPMSAQPTSTHRQGCLGV